MRYLIRAVKYFISICVLLVVILGVLALLGFIGRDVNSIFEKGWTSVGWIALMFAAVSAVYPRIKYTRRSLLLPGSDEEVRPLVEAEMERRGFRPERERDGEWHFRRTSFLLRLNRFFEDRIRFIRTADGYEVEGLTRDVVLIVNSLVYRSGGDAENE